MRGLTILQCGELLRMLHAWQSKEREKERYTFEQEIRYIRSHIPTHECSAESYRFLSILLRTDNAKHTHPRLHPLYKDLVVQTNSFLELTVKEHTQIVADARLTPFIPDALRTVVMGVIDSLLGSIDTCMIEQRRALSSCQAVRRQAALDAEDADAAARYEPMGLRETLACISQLQHTQQTLIIIRGDIGCALSTPHWQDIQQDIILLLQMLDPAEKRTKNSTMKDCITILANVSEEIARLLTVVAIEDEVTQRPSTPVAVGRR